MGKSQRRTTRLAGLTAAATVMLAAPFLVSGTAAAASTCTVMQVVAHEDDDLLFMNPDIEAQIRGGQCSITVFATAGNGEPTVRNRQNGIKDAYRMMAGVADQTGQTEWDASPVTVAGYPVEQFVLRDMPSVKLAFINLDDPLSSTGRPGLSKLWNNQATSMSVIDPNTDKPATTAPTTITRSGVSDVLVGLMTMYGPTTVRVQDTVPDSRYMTDHADHIATALFAQDAIHTYRLNTGIVPNVSYYRDYNITSSPENLDATNRATKTERFNVEYVALNPTAKVDASSYNWTYRTYYRWARGTSWVGKDADGRLEAFVVRDGEVFNYSQAADGTWAAAQSLGRPNQGFYPAVTVSKNADGRLAIFARGIDNTIMTAAQTAANASTWTAWTSLSSPNAGQSNAAQIGTPAVTVNQNGRMQLFVLNGSGALSTRVQSAANGTTWGSWQSLGGTGLQDPVVAVTNRNLIEVFADTTSTVKRFRQTTANGTVSADTSFTAGRPASPPSVAVDQDGRLEVQYRTAGSSSAAATTDIEMVVQNTVGGSWRTTRSHAGNQGGIGEPRPITVGLTSTDMRILSFTRNRNMGVSLVRQSAANSSTYSASVDLGGSLVDYPAAAVDRNNLVTVFGIGLDGGLWINQQTTAGPTAGFAGWVRI